MRIATIARHLIVAGWASSAFAQSPTARPDFRVILLGTGTPRPTTERMGPSILVEAAHQRLVFDVGRGTTIRLTEAGVALRDIDAVFITHLHSDHVNGLSDLWLTGWLPAAYAQRTTPFVVYGPTGTEEMMGYLRRAFEPDIRIRVADEGLDASGVAIDATDITEGVVYERGGLRVSAFEVDHGELIKPALGYRVEFDGRSVVLSGDTRPSTNLVAHAKGADVVIHEVMAVSADVLEQSEAARRIMAHHTSPEEAGRIFAELAPGLAVYSHVILNVSEEDLVRRTKAEYAGPLEIGRDLMTITVEDVPLVNRSLAAND